MRPALYTPVPLTFHLKHHSNELAAKTQDRNCTPKDSATRLLRMLCYNVFDVVLNDFEPLRQASMDGEAVAGIIPINTVPHYQH